MSDVIKVTVGIPAYKVEDYIGECISSAAAQTYRDLEIIVVDDCSPDLSGKIADNLARDDARIRVIHKEKNEGLAAARETIVHEMTGDAVYWLDSDDYLRDNAIEEAVRIMNSQDADIVKTIITPAERKWVGTYGHDEYMKILLPNLIKSNVIGCLIRKEMYKGVHHPIGMNYEDYDTFPQLMANVQKIVLIDSDTYVYRYLRPGSITQMQSSAFKGYIAKGIHACSRYLRFSKTFPNECGEVLKQFVDNACMAHLYAPQDADLSQINSCIQLLRKDVKDSPAVHPYKKWLYEAVIRNSILLPVFAVLHKTSGRRRLRKLEAANV